MATPNIVAMVGGVSRRLVSFLLAVAAALAAAAPASASLSDEVSAGRTLAQRLQAGKTTCDRLATDDFEHLGEYVMNRMTGSLQLHGAMNERMRSVVGADIAERMHVLVGQRYAGCASTGSVGPTMAPGMMAGRGWSNKSTWGSMVDVRGWDWTRDGNWQHMSRADWQRVSDQWMGPGMMRAAANGWHARDYVLAGLGLLVVGGLVGALFVGRPWRHHGDVGTP
jgi:hypothetical protein